MSILVTILRSDEDRSYTDVLLEIIDNCEDSIIFKERTARDYEYEKKNIVILKKNIKSISNAECFEHKLPTSTFEFKEISISPNKVTGDRSYTRETFKMVAENETHFQIYVKGMGVTHIATLCRHEYDIKNQTKSIQPLLHKICCGFLIDVWDKQ